MTAPAPRKLPVDVVITNHNYGAYLGDAIDSARAQTHPEVCVIVVDDGSTDESHEILRSFDGKVEVLAKENGGQASALNAGLARCEGDVVIFLDADDRLRPEAAARVSAALAADEALAKVQFHMEMIDTDGRPRGTQKPGGHLRPPTGDVRRAELAFPFDLPWLPGGGTAFRTEVVRRVLPIPEAAYPVSGADWYLVHLCALLGDSALLDDVCAEYRVHGSNAYEQREPRLDLRHVRASVAYAAATARELERLADQLRLERPGRILSVSDVANRMISLRLEPEAHPVSGDTALRLLRDGVRATMRRFDASAPMKLLFGVWFALAAAAPRRLTYRLAELFLFPERRPRANGLLARIQHRNIHTRPNGA